MTTNDNTPRLQHPDLIKSVEDMIVTAKRLNIVVAIAVVSHDTQEISAFGMCCPSHLCQLLRDTADAVEKVEKDGDVEYPTVQ